MNAHPSWATAVPLTTELLRARAPRREDSLRQFEPFFQLIPPQVAEEIQKLNPAPVRASIAGDGFRLLTPEEQEDKGFIYHSMRGPLRFWMDSDRAFDLLLCELAFGGVGIQPGEEEANRPPSNLEKRMRTAMLAEIAKRVPAAVTKSQEIPLVAVDTSAPNYKKPKPVLEDCIQLRILINAFSIAAEIQILFAQADLAKVMNVTDTKPKPKGPAAREVMDECPFELGIYLQPVQIPLQLILNLEPGALLPLGITTATPVTVKCEEVELSFGSLSVEGQNYRVVLGEAESTGFGAESPGHSMMPGMLPMPDEMPIAVSDFPPMGDDAFPAMPQ